MRLDAVESIVSAVLYEGYVLYPYRPSSVKNRQRWTFGGLYPEPYSAANGNLEPSLMQTECLVKGTEATTLEVVARFLHILSRDVRESDAPCNTDPADVIAATHPVESLWVDGKLYQTWQEATEREAGSAVLTLDDLLKETHTFTFSYPEHSETEILRLPTGELAGALVRSQEVVSGAVEVSAQQVAQDVQGVYKVTIRITNSTPWQGLQGDTRKQHDAALLRTLASTHTILGVNRGEFISLIDPPEAYKEAAASCQNTGTWPVLIGQDGDHDMLLSSPIILYDYPQVAPESHGDLFDGTEIDEILTLRIMTLTEEEKAEMRAVDDRARALLDRTESLTGEQMMQLHGTIRGLMVREEAENG